jgi:hypothetical protein
LFGVVDSHCGRFSRFDGFHLIITSTTFTDTRFTATHCSAFNMLMNYHELTMDEPANSPAKRSQFAVIMAGLVAGLSYLIMTSGVAMPIEPTEGTFPGGQFCYKLAKRDYAASMGMGRRIMMDATETETNHKFTNVERRLVEKNLYHVFLDNPTEFSGRALRWASGMLVSESEKEISKKLMALNTKGKQKKREPTKDELQDLAAGEVMNLLPYQLADLPSVKALVLQFPNSHGFASALVTNYKV